MLLILLQYQQITIEMHMHFDHVYIQCLHCVYIHVDTVLSNNLIHHNYIIHLE